MPSSVKVVSSNIANISNLIILDNQTSVASQFIRENTRIETIKLPSGITAIGSQAFYGCRALTLVDCRSLLAVPTLADVNAFTNTATGYKIVVPDALYNDWIVAANWSDSTIVSHIISVSDYANL